MGLVMEFTEEPIYKHASGTRIFLPCLQQMSINSTSALITKQTCTESSARDPNFGAYKVSAYKVSLLSIDTVSSSYVEGPSTRMLGLYDHAMYYSIQVIKHIPPSISYGTLYFES